MSADDSGIRSVTSHWRNYALTIVLFVCVTVVAWARVSPAARVALWAEDGTIFVQRALDPAGLPWGVFTPYAGYVHSLPQSIASTLVSIVPLPDLALWLTVMSCTVTGCVGALVFALTATWPMNLAGRAVASATTVLVPGLTFEVLGNIANLHWFALWLAPFVFLARPRTWSKAIALAVCAAAITTTEIQTALFAPLLLVRVRNRKRWPMAVGATLGLLLQAVALATSHRGGTRTEPGLLSLLNGYMLQVPLVGLSGSAEAASTVVGYSGWSAAYLALVPFICCGIAFVVARPSRQRIVILAAVLLSSLALWFAGYGLNRSSKDFGNLSHESLVSGEIPLLRYAIVPMMLLFLLVAFAAGSVHQNRRDAWLRPSVSTAVVALCGALFVAHFTIDVQPRRAEGTPWREQVSIAAAECAAGTAGASTQVRIPPLRAEWIVTLPCDRLN